MAEDLKQMAKDAFAKFGKVPLNELYADDCIFHELPEGQQQGIPAFEAAYGPLLGGASDVEVRLLTEPVVEGEMVSVAFETSMTHTGDIMGVPGTGKRLVIKGVDLARWKDGKMVERWEYADLLGLMQQLGLMAG